MSARNAELIEAFHRAADVLEERPYMDPVAYLRDCADELEDE